MAFHFSLRGIIARFPENIVMEVSNSLEVVDIGFILFFVFWLIIIYFTLYIIQIVRKVPLQYVSSIRAVQYITLKITPAVFLPIIFS